MWAQRQTQQRQEQALSMEIQRDGGSDGRVGKRQRGGGETKRLRRSIMEQTANKEKEEERFMALMVRP